MSQHARDLFQEAMYEHEQLAIQLILKTTQKAEIEQRYRQEMSAADVNWNEADKALKDHRQVLEKFARQLAGFDR